MVEKWKLKLVYNNIIRFIFTTDVTISPVFYYFPFCPFLHNYRRQYSHHFLLLPPLPPAAAASAFFCCFCLMISASLAILCSLVIPALAACSLAALLFPLSFLAAFSLARSLWLPLVILDNVALLRGKYQV